MRQARDLEEALEAAATELAESSESRERSVREAVGGLEQRDRARAETYSSLASSLQAAVHLAGARSSIGSLWQVPDQAAAELMTEFYRHLWTGDESKASALWKAKCDLRAQGRPPRDWAAWVLSGTPD